tara:strand:- start:7294 stop:8139 length:846 start_codon:yes stop_codon:yes gene_type:complete
MGKLDGKVAIVTGASRGIGKEIAKLFAAEGASVACAARTLTEGSFYVEGSLESTIAEIQQAGGSAVIVQCDVADPEACAQLVDTARQEFGPIDVLVNNASQAPWGPTKDIALNDWMNGLAIVVTAPMLLSQKVLPDMLERGDGAIINVSTWMAAGPGRGPYDSGNMMGETAYGTVKAALERFTQGLAQEVYPDGITVAAIAPCLGVPTPQLVAAGLFSGPDDPSGESPEMMAKSLLLLATEPPEKVSGRVTYSQVILQEFGLIEADVEIGMPPAVSPFSDR